MRVEPFLLFDGDCAEAMGLYQSCLGGELTVTRLGDTPMRDRLPEAQHHKLVYARLEHPGGAISATDWLHPTRRPLQGNTVALYLSDAPLAELRTRFDRLAEDGDPDLRDDLRVEPFGVYGHLADRFGVHWFFRGDPEPAG